MTQFHLPEIRENQFKEVERLHNLLSPWEGPIESIIPMSEVEDICSTILRSFFLKIKKAGYDIKNLPSAHDQGHILRDCARSFMLIKDSNVKNEMTSEDLISGVTGGTLHGIIILIMERYGESKRIIRHAEASALFVEKFLDLNCIENEFGKEVRDYILAVTLYAIASHTNYTREYTVNGYTIKPYKKTWESGAPIWSRKLTLWADSQDLNGPVAILRLILPYYLESREDHINNRFVNMEFSSRTMYPYIAKSDDGEDLIPSSAIAQMSRFISTMDKEPYCQYDLPGLMTDYRNRLKEIGMKILESPDDLTMDVLSQDELCEVFINISMCGENGQKQIRELVERFNTLPKSITRRWYELFTRAHLAIKEMEEKNEFGEKEAMKIAKKIIF